MVIKAEELKVGDIIKLSTKEEQGWSPEIRGKRFQVTGFYEKGIKDILIDEVISYYYKLGTKGSTDFELLNKIGFTVVKNVKKKIDIPWL